MAVLDITIPTGYIIQQQKLDAYILSQSVRNLQRARFQERKVLFYFNFVSTQSLLVSCIIWQFVILKTESSKKILSDLLKMNSRLTIVVKGRLDPLNFNIPLQ